MKNVIDFHLFWFDSNLCRNRFIELSSELGGTNSWPRSKFFLDLGIFWLGLSNFWIGAWFPFDAFQFSKKLYIGGASVIKPKDGRRQGFSVETINCWVETVIYRCRTTSVSAPSSISTPYRIVRTLSTSTPSRLVRPYSMPLGR